MMTAASPCAWSSPAAMAISLPKLREKETAVSRASAALTRRKTFSVSSLEPSSMKMTWKDDELRSSTGTRRASSGSMFSASLNTGTTTAISARARAPGYASAAMLRVSAPEWSGGPDLCGGRGLRKRESWGHDRNSRSEFRSCPRYRGSVTVVQLSEGKGPVLPGSALRRAIASSFSTKVLLPSGRPVFSAARSLANSSGATSPAACATTSSKKGKR